MKGGRFMNCDRRCNFTACRCIGILISIVLGALIGVLYAFNLITFITIALWIVFGLGILFLIFLVIAVNLDCIKLWEKLKA